MRAERVVPWLHGATMLLALVAALAWPRAGQAALMVPLSNSRLAAVLDWAEREQAELIELDSASGRVVARVSNNRSLLSALGSGIVPIAMRDQACGSRTTG
jgi:hypothetical protein